MYLNPQLCHIYLRPRCVFLLYISRALPMEFPSLIFLFLRSMSLDLLPYKSLSSKSLTSGLLGEKGFIIFLLNFH